MTHEFDSSRENCPLCGGSIVHHLSISHPLADFTTDRCEACGFIFMNPPFSDRTIESFYMEDYYSGSSDFSYIDEREKETFARYVWNARLHTIRKFVQNGNFLDIGASFGGFLTCAENYFTPHGIELSSYSGSFAQDRFGDNIHIGTLENAPFPDNYFSAITMIELIEHLKDPLYSLKKCRKLLKKDGILVIQTADLDGWQAITAGKNYHYYLPGHISYFTEKSLTLALRAVGFSRIHIFRPVDFGLLPKLKKSRGDFHSFRDYARWISIASYHLKGKFRKKGHPLTSSMVVYAIA